MKRLRTLLLLALAICARNASADPDLQPNPGTPVGALVWPFQILVGPGDTSQAPQGLSKAIEDQLSTEMTVQRASALGDTPAPNIGDYVAALLLSKPRASALRLASGARFLVYGAITGATQKGLELSIVVEDTQSQNRWERELSQAPAQRETLAQAISRIVLTLVRSAPVAPRPKPAPLRAPSKTSKVRASTDRGPKRAITAHGKAEKRRAKPQTTNPWAKGLFWGGVAAAAVGAALGLTAKFAFNAPLNDGSLRSAQEARSLLDRGRALALAADITLIASASSIGFSLALWLFGLGNQPVSPQISPERGGAIMMMTGALP